MIACWQNPGPVRRITHAKEEAVSGGGEFVNPPGRHQGLIPFSRNKAVIHGCIYFWLRGLPTTVQKLSHFRSLLLFRPHLWRVNPGEGGG